MPDMATAADRLPPAAVAVLSAVGLSVAGLGTAVALVAVASLLVRFSALSLPVETSIGLTIVLQSLGYGLVALVYLRTKGLGADFLGLRMPTVRDLIWAGAGYALTMVLYVAIAVGIRLSGLQPAQNRIQDVVGGDPTLVLLLVPLSILLIGPGEELLFRGLVQGRLRQTFGPAIAIGLATFVFAIIHYPSLSGSATGQLIYVAIISVPGLIFGVAYEYTDNLVVPALIHGLYNATLFALLYVALRFAPESMGPGTGTLVSLFGVVY